MDLDYENNNLILIDDLVEIKCKNYELCDDTAGTIEFLECWGDRRKYLCINCIIMFDTWGSSTTGLGTGTGLLEFRDDIDCAICFETKRGVSQPRCSHFFCIDCFKKWVYGDEEPQFPYSDDVEEEYNNDKDDPKWEKDYPLIKTYLTNWEEWQTKTENHNQCPLCRA